MPFGMSPQAFGHTLISLVGIASGFVVAYGLLTAKRQDGWTSIFLWTTVMTSVTGFMLPADRILPSHIVGTISLVVLAIALYARYNRQLAGSWRWIYVATAMTALYFNVFVLVVQLFLKVPGLKALAPTQSEPPFALSQGAVLALFIGLSIAAAKRFRGFGAVNLKKENAMSKKQNVARLLAVFLSVSFIMPPITMAQGGQGGGQKSSVLPSGGGVALLDPNDTVLLLLDHQSGLFQTVKDISVAELRANTVMLAKLATLLKIPVITTASEPNGPNGPLMPEIHQYAPHAVFVPRKGEVNAWDNQDFVNTVKATGRKTLIMAGVWTSVCVMFPALDAKAAGFIVYAVMDASGDPSEMASRTTLARFTQAGVIPISANAVLCEIHRTWNRPEAAELAKLYMLVAPNYAAVMESYLKAQEVAKQKK